MHRVVQADFDKTLYDNAGGPYNVILQRNVILGGYTWAAGAVYGDLLTGSFNGVATLSASTVYNLAMKQRNANNITYHETRLIDVATTAIAGMWNGGTDMKGILRASTGATAFTVSSTQFPYVMGIICSGFDDGAGGGGGGLLVHPGMGGGARG